MRYNNRQEVERIGQAGALSEWHGDDDSRCCRMLSSYWLYCEYPDETFTRHAANDGYWESWITTWFSNNVTPNDKFFDIGANVGYYTGWAAQHNCREVVSFEPNPKVYRLLEKSIKLNGWENVTPENIALSNQPGKVTLHIPEGHSGAASIVSGGAGITVQAWPLDDVCLQIFGKSVAKIDAEGAEPLIWEGMQKNWETGNFTVVLEWQRDRYDAEAFATELYEKADVSIITHEGMDRFLSKDELLDRPDLEMLVLRKRR